MKKRFLSLLLLTPLLLGCQGNIHYERETYFTKDLKVDNINNFVICSMSDIHLSVISNLYDETNYLERCIRSYNGNYDASFSPNLITLDGDIFMDCNKTIVDKFLSWLDSLNIPFSFVYGNHDLQGSYSYYWFNARLLECKNIYFVNPKNDDVYGNSNYVTNIKVGDEIKWQLYYFDSNNYKGLAYDIVHEDQINWYREMEEKTKEIAGRYVPAISYMHIPLEEFDEVRKIVKNDKNDTRIGAGSYWYFGEGVACGYKDNNLFETFQEFGAVKAIVSAHDHIDNTDISYNKDGNGAVRLIYNTKTGRGIYHDRRIMGCNFFTLKEDGTFTNKRMLVGYDNSITEMTNDYIKSIGGDYK